MKKIAVATDSNSGITQEEAKKSGVFVLPMPFTIGDQDYFEDINLTQKEFYEKLKLGDDIHTSQPSVGSLVEFWENILKDYDEVVYIPMSSGLSQSCESAKNFAREFEGKVFVVDNQRISVTQKGTVYNALELIKKGKSASEIQKILEDTRFDSSIYIMVNTLKYVKKGGRVTAAGAAIGTLLNIKPVLQIQGGKLDAYAKVLSVKQACQTMIRAIKKDLDTRFSEYVKNGEMALCFAHTDNEEGISKFVEQVRQAIPDVKITYVDPLSLSVSCHIGPGALAIACYREIK